MGKHATQKKPSSSSKVVKKNITKKPAAWLPKRGMKRVYKRPSRAGERAGNPSYTRSTSKPSGFRKDQHTRQAQDRIMLYRQDELLSPDHWHHTDEVLQIKMRPRQLLTPPSPLLHPRRPASVSHAHLRRRATSSQAAPGEHTRSRTPPVRRSSQPTSPSLKGQDDSPYGLDSDVDLAAPKTLMPDSLSMALQLILKIFN